MNLINQSFVSNKRGMSDFDITREVIEKSDVVRNTLVGNLNFFIYEGNNPAFTEEVKKEEGLTPKYLFVVKSLDRPKCTGYFVTDIPYSTEEIYNIYGADYKVCCKIEDSECFSIFPNGLV